MRRIRAKMTVVAAVLTALLVAAAFSTAARAEVIDRIVATVNGHVILQSDWDDALRYGEVLTQRLRAPPTSSPRTTCRASTLIA